MSWLIESFLNETKECNKTRKHDHPGDPNINTEGTPDAWPIHTAEDYRLKKRRMQMDKEYDRDRAAERLHRKNQEAEKHGKERLAKEYNTAVNASAHDRKFNGSDVKTRADAETRAMDAVHRHNRRHPEAKLESTDMLVEIMQ